MQRRLMWSVLIGAAIAASVGSALATPSNGFASVTLAKGQFAPFDATSYFVRDNGKVWAEFQKTKGKSDGYVLSNVWQPGGDTGWHTHPSFTLIIVTAGAITQYEADDPSCTPHVYTAGMSFVDRGGSHVHTVRNEGDVEADVIAVRLVPSGQSARIDEPDPGNCPF